MASIEVHLTKEMADIFRKNYAPSGDLNEACGKEIKLHGCPTRLVSINECPGEEDCLDVRMNIPNHLMSLFRMEVEFRDFSIGD